MGPLNTGTTAVDGTSRNGSRKQRPTTERVVGSLIG
jgi:hypothetical protein